MWRPILQLVACLTIMTPVAPARTVAFNRDVRPLLSNKCFRCHGPDAKAKNIPMRLDSEAAMLADLGSGRHPVVPGDPDRSEIVHRITAPQKGMRMPPVSSGVTLTPAEIETVREWVAQGAKWQRHWAFIPPVRPPLPEVKDKTWARNAIDNFILERLEREGLKPSHEADPETLLRRVTLDITGLPPTPAEIDAFVADKSANAYEKVVDRLLASPRYGERMAMRWLDAARYADTNGYQYDGERSMWRWRDWVIDAFNRNERYNQFVLEQLAGDMLPNASLDQIIATGFNRNHRANTEDGIVAEEYAIENVVDRVDTVATVFLGLTLGCARCHNHKYDPITQKEFYQVFAYFNNVPERGRAMKYGNSPPLVPAPTAEQQGELRNLERQIQERKQWLVNRQPAIQKAQTKWERDVRKSGPLYWAPDTGIVAALPFDSNAGAKMNDGEVALEQGRIGKAARFDGRAYLDAGNIAPFDIDDHFSISVWVRPDGISDGAVVTRQVDNPKGKGFGIEFDRGKVLAHVTNVWESDALRLRTEEPLAAGEWYHLALTYDGSSLASGLKLYVNGKLATCKTEQDTLYRPFRNAGKEFKAPLRIGGGAGPAKRFRGLIDEVRVYKRILGGDEIAVLALGEPLNAIAAKAAPERSEAEGRLLRWCFLDRAAPRKIARAWHDLKDISERKDELQRAFPTVMVMAECPAPKESHLLIRGAYDKPGDKVEPGLPAVLPPLPPAAPNNRLGFAKWVVDAGNPLTARVAVNRFWQTYFATGLVKTSEDFGAQGEWPSHPELLDWLATEFVRTGWDVKAMQKLIVSSATYRQSSSASPQLIERDPENRLLARGARFRLPAEMIRDQALAAAGLLVEKTGGPPVKPYQPEGLWKEVVMQDAEYHQDHGQGLWRRTLYTFWKRTVAPPMTQNFDAANRESCVVRETRTNTPLQALDLMNDVTFLEAARMIGQRMMKEGGGTPESRLRFGFRLVLGRGPSPAEEKILRDDLNFHLDYFASEPERVQSWLDHGEAPSDPSLDRMQLAAYGATASLLLNMDEAITKE